MNRYFKYLVLPVFVVAVLLIIFLQFNSNSSINKLIDGNENMIHHLEMRARLQRLRTDIIALENNIRGAVISGTITDSEHLKSEVQSLGASLTVLNTLSFDSHIQPLVLDLKKIVKQKVDLDIEALDSLKLKGKMPAEKIINDERGRVLTDSIRDLITRIDEQHQAHVITLTKEADINGSRAKYLGTFMAGVSVMVLMLSFAYIVYRYVKQQQLITRLNISEKKAKDAALVKENFLANMSHEIRTPLNAILGFTNLLQRNSADARSKEYIQTIRQSGESLLTIVNDVLDLSKIEAGMMRIESAPFSIRQLLHSVETMFQPKATEKKLLLVARVADDVPDHLEGDANRLTQVLINLIGNAVKFTATGAVSVMVENRGVTNDKQQIGITVNDTGIGIEAGKLDKIFDRFEQAEDAVTRKYGGTGLGLSIVKELVLLQQGTIHAESVLGTGTTFKLMIPYAVSVETEGNRLVQLPEQFVPLGMEQLKVLVVEDNRINQTLLEHLLNNWQVGFEIAGNGKEALELLAHNHYHLILMDIQMPEMDGYTAAQHIRQSLRLDTPIIAMTAHALPGEREKCLGYGMNEYISKPIQEGQLYQLIRRFSEEGVVATQSAEKPLARANNFKHIDLAYMQAISQGDLEYEKLVTGQFLEIIPQCINDLYAAWTGADLLRVKQIAHDMKTSVSIMGLTETVEKELDSLENGELTASVFGENYYSLKQKCDAALADAQVLYASL